MKRVIWLKTARVYATDSDMTAKVERTTVKLEDGDNFNKFIKYIPLKGYKKDELPSIEKVMENKDGQWVEIDKQPWVEKLNEILKVVPVADEKIDFKLLSERQANELKSTKATLAAMNERLQALESKKQKKDETPASPERLKLEAKAKELNIKFMPIIGDEKLLAKIQKIEPEYK
jgi:hypothetical protein